MSVLFLKLYLESLSSLYEPAQSPLCVPQLDIFYPLCCILSPFPPKFTQQHRADSCKPSIFSTHPSNHQLIPHWLPCSNHVGEGPDPIELYIVPLSPPTMERANSSSWTTG